MVLSVCDSEPMQQILYLLCVGHLGNEVVIEEDVGRPSEHGVGGGVLGLGLQEGVWGEARHRGVVQLWLEVYQSHRHLEGEGRSGERH